MPVSNKASLRVLVSHEAVQVPAYRQARHSLNVPDPMVRKSWYFLRTQPVCQLI